MFDNLDLLGQREGHINELGTRAQLLRTDAKVLKKNATKARRHFCARKYMMWFFCGLAFIAIVIGVILILKLWARVF